ncbi:MAG: radical SAM protein [Candidatus Thorarchaeota archaeon]|nr:MAG: radical SAM protein [Candidatus Thorarchaeota archaeon]
MQHETVKAKSLLSKPIVADAWFHVNRSMNAYRGCEHGCVYCDGMAEHYHVDNFTTHIRIKENAAKVLRRELKKDGYTSQTELETETLWRFMDPEDAKRMALRVPRKKVIGVCGGVSDGYQPAEKEHKITRQVLETLLDFRMPVFVLTKSDLVLRDLDLLKEINESAFANIMFTITLSDEKQRGIFEPKASSTPERFAALKEIRKAGLPGGVMATPIIPTIGDNLENMTALAKEAKRAKAEFIQFGGMTLKPGRQKGYFLRVIKRRFPDKLSEISNIYANNNKYGTPDWKRLPVNVMLRGYKVCRSVGIRDRSVRNKLKSEPDSNNAVLGVLLDIEFYMRYMLGMPWNKIRPFHELSARIERGIEDLVELRREGQLKSRLLITDRMVSIVEEIMDTGSCRYIQDLVQKTDSKVAGETVFVAFPDE